MDLEKLVVPITADVDNFMKGINNAKSGASGLVDGISNIGGGVVAGALGVAGAGVAGLSAILFDSTKKAMDAENIQADLNATLLSTKGVSGMTAQSINDLATSLSQVTKFEDDTIVTGQNMLLTFTSIGKDVFPMATTAMLNMATKMGKQPVDMAVQLGKALNSPVAGISALTRVGVVFTDKQKEMIKTMEDAGDIEGAQKVILGELNTEFGGLAEAAGTTTTGKLDIFKNKLNNIQDNIGAKVIPVMSALTDVASNMLSNPAVMAGIDSFINGVSNVANNIIANIPTVISYLQQLPAWFQNNQPIIIGILSALGVAVAAWAITSVIAIGSVIISALPIIATLALIGVAAYGLYYAWTTNFGGIQDKAKAVWEFLQPVFNNIKTWLETNIPIGIAILKLKFGELQNTFAIVWSWVDTNLMPLFKSLSDLMGILMPISISGLSTAFGVVWPIVQNYVVWSFNNLMNVIKLVADFVGGSLKRQFDLVTGTINNVTNAVQNVVSWLRTLNGTNVNVNANVNSSTSSTKQGRATGGQLQAGQTVWVGENGAETFTAGKGGGYVTPTNKLNDNTDMIGLLQQIASNTIDYYKLSRVMRETMLQGG
jgi:hypothetical protein